MHHSLLELEVRERALKFMISPGLKTWCFSIDNEWGSDFVEQALTPKFCTDLLAILEYTVYKLHLGVKTQLNILWLHNVMLHSLFVEQPQILNPNNKYVIVLSLISSFRGESIACSQI